MVVLIGLVIGLAWQYVDDRNLFEVLQDDLDTAKVHARLTPDQRRAIDRSTTLLVKAAAKLRAHKPFDKAEVRAALKEIAGLEEQNVFPDADRKILAEDLMVVELGVGGKILMDAPRRARGSVY